MTKIGSIENCRVLWENANKHKMALVKELRRPDADTVNLEWEMDKCLKNQVNALSLMASIPAKSLSGVLSKLETWKLEEFPNQRSLEDASPLDELILSAIDDLNDLQMTEVDPSSGKKLRSSA